MTVLSECGRASADKTAPSPEKNTIKAVIPSMVEEAFETEETKTSDNGGCEDTLVASEDLSYFFKHGTENIRSVKEDRTEAKNSLIPSDSDLNIPAPTVFIKKAGPAFVQNLSIMLAFCLVMRSLLYRSSISLAPTGYPETKDKIKTANCSPSSPKTREDNGDINLPKAKTHPDENRKSDKAVNRKSDGTTVLNDSERPFITPFAAGSLNKISKTPAVTVNEKSKTVLNFNVIPDNLITYK